MQGSKSAQAAFASAAALALLFVAPAAAASSQPGSHADGAPGRGSAHVELPGSPDAWPQAPSPLPPLALGGGSVLGAPQAGDEVDVSCGGFAPAQRECQAAGELKKGQLRPYIEADPGYHGSIELKITTPTGLYKVNCDYLVAGFSQRDCTVPTIQGEFREDQVAMLVGESSMPSVGTWKVGFVN